jgi:hypothetical protein
MRARLPAPANDRIRLKHRLRVALATMLVFSMAVYVGSAVAVDTRVDRRAAEMPLPDPYLDPTWPEEEPVEGLGERYEAGDTDNVDEVPFDDEVEFQADQKALQALTGEGPPSPEGADPLFPVPALPIPAKPTGDAPAPGAPGAAPAIVDDEILPEDDNRDPVEW